MSSSADLVDMLQHLVDTTAALVPGGCLDERTLLHQSLVKLALCVKRLRHARRTEWGDHTRLEVDAQIQWIHAYSLCREEWPCQHPAPQGYLVPHSRDPEARFVAFAQEALQGALCLAAILDPPEQRAWAQVKRAKKRSALPRSCAESENSADESEDSEEDCLDEAFQYKEAYF